MTERQFKCGTITYTMTDTLLKNNYGEHVGRLELARAITLAKTKGYSIIPSSSYGVEWFGKAMSIGCRYFTPSATKKIVAWAAAGARAHARRKAKNRR